MLSHTAAGRKYCGPSFYRDPQWIECNDKRKPEPFDLVYVKDREGTVQPGWWTGFTWDFGKQRIKDPHEWRVITEYII